MVLALNVHVLLPKKRGKTILHLHRSSSTSINSWFVKCSRFLEVLNKKSSKMNAAKILSSSFRCFNEASKTASPPASPPESLDQMLWIEVLNSCFASLMVKLTVGWIVTSVTSVVFATKAKAIKSVKSKLYQAKGLTLSGMRTLY